MFKKYASFIVAGFILVSLGFLSSCSKEKDKHTLKIAYSDGIVSQDPTTFLNSFEIWYGQLVFDPLALMTFSKNDPLHPTISPTVATKWQWMDEKTLRIWVRSGLNFKTGNPVRAEDVKWSFNRVRNEDEYKGLFQSIKNVKTYPNTQGMQNIVDLELNYHDPLLINLFFYVFTMDQKFYAGKNLANNIKDRGFNYNHESGSGAFNVKSWQQGVKLVLTRNKNYWNKGTGNVETVVFTPIKDNATRVSSLLSGDVDVIYPLPPESIDKVKNNKNTTVVTRAGTRTIVFLFNSYANPQLKNKLVRQAIIMAVNQEAITNNVLPGIATPTAQLSPKSYSGYNSMLSLSRQKTYNLEKAKMLMKKAGYPNGFSMTIASTNNRYVNDAQVTQAVGNMLSKIGIKVNVKTMPKAEYYGTFYKDYKNSNFGMAMIGWQSDTMDSNNFYEALLMCHNSKTGDGPYNVGFCDPKLDKLIIKARTIKGTAQRDILLKKIAQYVYDNALAAPLYQENLVWGVRKGINWDDVADVNNFQRLENVTISPNAS